MYMNLVLYWLDLSIKSFNSFVKTSNTVNGGTKIIINIVCTNVDIY